MQNDLHWMEAALALAHRAYHAGEIPIGAVIVLNDEQIGSGWNAPISQCDPTAHAEIVALRDAAATVGNYRLPNATIFVTLAPCAMCYHAIAHARLSRLVYGAPNPHPTPPAGFAVTPLMSPPCSALIKDFFRARRAR